MLNLVPELLFRPHYPVGHHSAQHSYPNTVSSLPNVLGAFVVLEDLNNPLFYPVAILHNLDMSHNRVYKVN